MKYFSSRPTENEDPFVLDDLVPAELELIAALLCNVRLGNHSVYAQAAFSLMEKITDYVGDEDYLVECANAVNITVDITDSLGWTVTTVDNNHFELDV